MIEDNAKKKAWMLSVDGRRQCNEEGVRLSVDSRCSRGRQRFGG